MIRALILWLAKRFLAKYVSAALAGQIVDALSAGYDEIKARGEGCVACTNDELRTRQVTIRTADPGAKRNTLDDILKSENNPAG